MGGEVEEVTGVDCSPCCTEGRCRYVILIYHAHVSIRSIVISLLLGQLVSLCLCGTAVTSQILSINGVQTPAGMW